MTINSNKLAVVVTAAGSSTRMGGGIKKEYLELCIDGKKGTVLSFSAKAFLTSLKVDLLIITTKKNGTEDAKKALFRDNEILPLLKDTKLIFTEGGATRQESVFNALREAQEALEYKDAVVLIHDAARPYVTKKIILDTFNTTLAHGAATPVLDAVDTQVETEAQNNIRKISRHLERKNIKALQTPQGFLLNELIKCHKNALLLNEKGKTFTDDTEIWDSFPAATGGKKVCIVEGDIKNKKITFKEDLPQKESIMQNIETRVGIGTDLHRLCEGRDFVLGGIKIPSDKGEYGHSDGDVLLHAVSDALLGASHLGDIGSYFPPAEEKWKDADSRELLKKIWADVKSNGWTLVNLDCVVETERPKILPWREKIISSIAKTLEVPEKKVFIKAKTNEGQDSVGLGNAIKAYAVCLIQRSSQ